MPEFTPRPAQAAILEYTQGKMGIAAVPGSGKTHTLSYLAAQIIQSEHIQDDQEVLVVTLVNAAVQNFSKRIGTFVRQFGLLENIGYRVRTLHGLAHDIVRERPDLAGLSNNFQILDERASNDLLDQVVTTWQRNNQDIILSYTHPDSLEKMRYIAPKWKQTLLSMASSFIHQAKDLQLTPDQIQTQMMNTQKEHDLLQFGISVYRDYQNALSYQAAIDFQDLIRLAYKTLKMDEDYLQRLRYQFPYILEDEAQDSSLLQEEILRMLCGADGNWVRVGDPNQAIYETFTTADPKYLLAFLQEKDVKAHDLPNSGRSTKSIISLANHLIDWNRHAPSPEMTSSLVPPFIETTGIDDPQPNPEDAPENIFLYDKKLSAEKEENLIVQSVKQWLDEHPDQTAAILVTRNDKGSSLVQKLKAKKVPTIELLQSSFSTRKTAKILANLLNFFADPVSAKKCAAAFETLYKDTLEDAEDIKALRTMTNRIKKVDKVENLFFNADRGNAVLDRIDETNHIDELFLQFIHFFQRNQQAAVLPIQQFLLTLSTQLFQESHELALSFKLAEMLQRNAKDNPTCSLKEHAAEMDKVYHNRTRIIGFSEEELEFDPDSHKGEVVVATVHKAKGLEWDRVYIVSANNYDYPSNQEYDQYISERYFIRNNLNLQAEMLEQLKALFENRTVVEGQGTQAARVDYSAERLRLFYVGITRARKELVITWNDGRFNNCVQALPFVELCTFWEKKHAETD